MVQKYTDPDVTTVADGSTYKGDLDNAHAVHARLTTRYLVHAQDTPDLTVRVSAGNRFNGITLAEDAAQNSAAMVAPSVNPRIDRIVLDPLDGTVSIITGAESASPVPPALTVGKLPLAQVALTTSTTVIVNADITDERSSFSATDAYLTVDANGQVNNSLQSKFLAVYEGANVNDVTGTGGNYSPAAFDTEIFDANGDFNTGTYRFTFPSTGEYLLGASMNAGGLADTHTRIIFRIITSNRTYWLLNSRGTIRTTIGDSLIYNASTLCDADAGDTAEVELFGQTTPLSIDWLDAGGVNAPSFFGHRII